MPGDRKTSQYTRVSTLVSGDLIEIVRTTNGSSDDANLAMEKADFDTYVQNLSAGSYTKLIIADGANGTILLGDKTIHESFEVQFLIGYLTKRFSGNIEVIYNTVDTIIIPPTGGGDDELIDLSNVNMAQLIVSGDSILWKISNNSGSNVTIQYRIAEQKPAL